MNLFKGLSLASIVAKKESKLLKARHNFKLGEKVTVVKGSYASAEMFITRIITEQVEYAGRSVAFPCFEICSKRNGKASRVMASPEEFPDTFAYPTRFIKWNVIKGERQKEVKECTMKTECAVVTENIVKTKGDVCEKKVVEDSKPKSMLLTLGEQPVRVQIN